MNRREFTASALLLSACARRGQFSVEEIDIASIGEALRGGRITARAVVEQYIARIESVDRSGPMLNAVIELNPDAVSIADSLDRELASKGPRSALHGIPILVKDNIDTADRMRTTAGSLALIDAPTPKQDAPVVARLRQAGAVILGKTNLSEWANIRSSRSTSGWSGRGGLTRNPYALDRNTSGSSSGSGAAAAASLCAAAVGTETDGSIVSPCSINGLAGIKPTVGLLSGQGIIPIAHSQDTAGPMTRTLRDAVYLLSAMNANGTDYSPFLDPNGLQSARLGVARSLFGRNPDVLAISASALDVLTKNGAELVDPVELPPEPASNAEMDVLLYELKSDLEAYLLGRGGRLKTLKDLITFNERHAAREMPWFGQENFHKAQALGGLDSPAYISAREKCRQYGQALTQLLDKHKLDAVVAPTDGPAWLTDFINGDHFTQSASTPAAVAGFPHITVPAGRAQGLPVGFSFFGRANSEGVLIRLAYAFEQATKARRAPKYARSLGSAAALTPGAG